MKIEVGVAPSDAGTPSAEGDIEKLVRLTSDEMPNTGRRLLNFDGEIERLVDRKAAEAIAAAANSAFAVFQGVTYSLPRISGLTAAVAQAPSSPSCTCRSLIHGHENACPFARDVR